MKKVTPKTKVTPVPDNQTKNIEERAVTPKPKHKEKVNTSQAKTTAKVKPNKQSITKKSTGIPKGGKASRARGERVTSKGRGRGCGCAIPIKMPFHSQPAIRKPKYIQEKAAPGSTALSESLKGYVYSVELIKLFYGSICRAKCKYRRYNVGIHPAKGRGDQKIKRNQKSKVSRQVQ